MFANLRLQKRKYPKLRHTLNMRSKLPKTDSRSAYSRIGMCGNLVFYSPVRAHSGMRIRRIFLRFTLLFALGGITMAFAADQKNVVDSIRDFYKLYLAYDYAKTPKTPRPAMALSKAFFAEVAKTSALCNKYGEGPCGWGADGDEYLDAQEIEQGLNYSNSRIAIREISSGEVQVKLNVYPSVQDAGDHYYRTITYKMMRESGSYVVDDIAYTDGISMRKKLSEERKQILAHARFGAAGKK